MSEMLLRNGLVLGPDSEIMADVRVIDHEVTEVAVDLLAGPGAEEIDCTGCWIGPGLVDLHTHLREPGAEHKEDIHSGSSAAAAGGFTAVVAMPNTEPAIDAGHMARFVSERGRAAGFVDVLPAGALSLGRKGEVLAHLDEMWDAGVRVFTDDGDTVVDAGLLRRAMEYVAQLGGVVAQHAIDPGLARGGHMHEGALSSRLGMEAIPSLAESVIVARDIALVRMTGVAYHVQHVSAAETVLLIAGAKGEGLPVTAEVTPHHLAFDQTFLESTDPLFKMMPPLRTVGDRDALRDAARTGVIDAIATDHAPHAAHETDVGFEEAPFGVIGLADAAAVANTVLGLSPRSFFERLSTTPARIAQVPDHGRWVTPGAPANLVVFDPDREIESTTTRSRAGNSPYLGRTWRGEVRSSILRGRLSYHAAKADVG